MPNEKFQVNADLTLTVIREDGSALQITSAEHLPELNKRQLTAFWNLFSPNPIKNFETREVGIRRLADLWGTKREEFAKAGKGPKKRGRKNRYSDDAVIHVLGMFNPKRLGTVQYKRFKLYNHGMSVKQFREAAERSVPELGESGWANAQMALDVREKNISIQELA